MLNSKQRAILKSAASRMDAIFQIGKGGIGDAAVKSIGDALEARELVKISVLDNSDETAREAAEELAERTGSEVVAVIGRKIILFKESSKPEKRKISQMICAMSAIWTTRTGERGQKSASSGLRICSKHPMKKNII